MRMRAPRKMRLEVRCQSSFKKQPMMIFADSAWTLGGHIVLRVMKKKTRMNKQKHGGIERELSCLSLQ